MLDVYLVLIFFIILCVWVYAHEWCMWRSEEDIRFPETEVTKGCEPPCQCWESNPGSLEEQPMCSTAETFIQLSTFGYI